MKYSEHQPPKLNGPSEIQIHIGEIWTSTIEVISKNLTNISIRCATRFDIQNNASVEKCSTDLPSIIEKSRTGNKTTLKLHWQPSELHISGFLVQAKDSRQIITEWGPNIYYCLCEHPRATCLFPSKSELELDKTNEADTTFMASMP